MSEIDDLRQRVEDLETLVDHLRGQVRDRVGQVVVYADQFSDDGPAARKAAADRAVARALKKDPTA